MRPVCFFSLLLLFLCFAGDLRPDTLLLRNGKKIEGVIIRQDRASITIRTEGKTRSVPRNQIRRLVFGPVKPKPSAAEKAKKAAAEKRKREQALARKRAEEKKQREARLVREREKTQRREAAKKRIEAKRQELAKQRAERETKAKLEEKKREEREARAQADRKARERAAQAEKKKQAAEETAQPAPPVKPAPVVDDADRFGALWRSAVLPGWGQSYQGRKSRARTWYGAMVGAALGTLFFYNRAGQSLDGVVALQENRDLFFALAGPSDGLALVQWIQTQQIDAAKTSANREILFSNLLLVGLAGGYFWNLRDVWNHSSVTGRSVEIGIATVGGDGIGPGLRVRF